jgi:hypothetical protein
MAIVKAFIPKDRYSLAVGFMVCMTLVIGFAYVDYHSRLKSVAETKAAGLASLHMDGAIFGGTYKSIAQRAYGRYRKAETVAFVGGGGGGGDATKLEDQNERKIVRKGTLNIVAKDTDAASQSLQRLARDLGGYVVSAERNNADEVVVNLRLRIPAAHLDEA